ncbi:zinc ribbon-containing protein [Acinetobacter oleivorans]|nr:hypothetical protein [Acinetobacter oleivorans]
MSTTGEKPGIGLYICNQCGQHVFLDNFTDRLPPCPRCGGSHFSP